jgi:methionyl-tRNA synthetase
VNSVDPECLRYAVASRLGPGLEEIDISPGRLTARINDELGGVIIGFIRRALDPGVDVRSSTDAGPLPETLLRHYVDIGEAYAAIDIRRALAGVREVVRAAQATPSPRLAVCRDLAILLTPVLPRLGAELGALLGSSGSWSWNDLGRPFTGRSAGAADALAGRLECRGMQRLFAGGDE